MGSCFYDEGLRFECQGCGYCCGCEPGYVFLSEGDIERMASGLGMERQAFIDTWCRIVDMGMFKMISLQEKENYDCIFLQDGKCRVYENRPKQCSTYPFWAQVLEDRQCWDEEARSCPGMNKGKLFTKEEIEAKLRFRLENEPVVIM